MQREWIVLCPGVVFLLHALIYAFTQTDVAVIVQLPVYAPFLSVPKIAGRRLLLNPLKFEHSRYRFDLVIARVARRMVRGYCCCAHRTIRSAGCGKRRSCRRCWKSANAMASLWCRTRFMPIWSIPANSTHCSLCWRRRRRSQRHRCRRTQQNLQHPLSRPFRSDHSG